MIELVRKIVLFFWIISIFILTCASPSNNAQEEFITFTWVSTSNHYDFFSPLPLLTEPFLLQKLGHVIMFFVLTLLIKSCQFSYSFTTLSSLFYGTVTEIFQLYFARGGRLYDVGVNAIGIAFALFLIVAIGAATNLNHSKSIS